MKYDTVFNSIQPVDGKAFVVVLGISARYQHDTYGRTRVYFQCLLIQVAGSHSFKEFYQITLDAKHHAFCFRVTHADIIFNHHRFTFYIDKTEEDETFVFDAFGSQSFHSGTDDAVFYLLHPFLIGKRNRRNATHATGIQTFVAFTYAFVVLCFGQNLVVLSVCQNEYGTFDATQKLFNDYSGGSITEHTAQHFF